LLQFRQLRELGTELAEAEFKILEILVGNKLDVTCRKIEG